MRHWLPLLAATLLLAACTSPPGGAPPAAPAGPPTLPATIRGSQETSTLLDHFTAFVSAVDGETVNASRQEWDAPVSLAPGRRVLAVEFVRGAFFARTELTLDARPGAAYELRHASDAQVYGAHTFCEFWIVDLATGGTVVPPKRVPLGKIKP